MSTFLIVVASLIFIIAFIDYNRSMFKGKSMPVFTGWALFTIITIVNVVINLSFTAKWTTTLLLATDWLICTGTSALIIMWMKGNVSIDKRDKQVAVISALAVMLWIAFKNRAVGVWLNQIAYSLAFIPTFRNVRRNPSDEPTRPWLVWTFAFILDIVALKLDLTSVGLDFVAPSVCLVWHATVTLLSLRKVKPFGLEY
ncbi:MAG: hypothetical protein WD898_00985 [Candidatus Paceibacterota bacterium]